MPLQSRRLAVLAASTLLVACAGGDDAGGTAATPSPDTAQMRSEPASDPPSSEAASPAAAPATAVDVTVSLQPLATLEQPTATAVRPGEPGALYVAERSGRVRVLQDGALTDTVVLDLSSQTTTDSERGLLGLAFDEDGSHLYVDHTDPEGHTRVAEYAMAGGSADPGTRRELLRVEQPYANHNGGQLAVGPDGHLYVGLGDGGAGGDPHDHGQDPGTLLGALLRIDPDGGDPYGIPADNPFADGDGGRPEVWAYGLRNPWRFSFDRATGDLWIADVGQDAREEIDFVPAGEGAGWNFGWNRLEGSIPFEGEAPADAVAPVFEYEHGDGRCSVTGGVVYRGDAIPDLAGVYVYGDFCSGELRGLAVADGEVVDEGPLGPTVPALAAIGEDAAGELYTLSLEGEISKVVP